MNAFNDEIIQRNNTRILSFFKVQPRFIPDTQPDEKSRKKPENTKVNDLHKRFLMAVYNGEYEMTVTEVCKSAGFPAGTGSRIAEECVRKNLIKMIQVPFGRGRPKYPVLLSEGYAILNIQGKTSAGRGAGYEHTLYQHLIKNKFSDLKPIIELNRNGKFIDVAIETNEFLICIEVAMTAVHEKENIDKDFSLAKASVVIIACYSEKVQREVQEIICKTEEYMRQRIEVILITDLLKIKSDKFIMKYQ